MMAIEKCDKVVINPLFGSGLQYKHRVSFTQYWYSILHSLYVEWYLPLSIEID